MGGVLYISSNRKNIKITEKMCGSLFCYKDEIYLIEFGEVVEDNSQGIKQLVLRSGKNRLIKFTNGEIIEAYNFTEGYTPMSLSIYDDIIYTYSAAIKRFCAYNMKGEYLYTLFDSNDYEISGDINFFGFIKEENKNSFYAIHEETGDLYKIYKE
jgi:hypothetical protein